MATIKLDYEKNLDFTYSHGEEQNNGTYIAKGDFWIVNKTVGAPLFAEGKSMIEADKWLVKYAKAIVKSGFF
ncbi:MAG: hypothetical protein U9N34_03060 [Candidatus Cloacimonadota bacterium]|nr:hypothetical protein [Candidatus Cloacimonadota bacterium]